MDWYWYPITVWRPYLEKVKKIGELSANDIHNLAIFIKNYNDNNNSSKM